MKMCSVRWAFRCASWTPSRAEWLFAARCIQKEEKERIGQFVFAKDAKSAMVGRLLIRKFVCEKMGMPWSEILLERSHRGKPYLAAPSKNSSDSGAAWSFNISHQGDYAVLAANQGFQVGVDIMKNTLPGSNSVPEFFRIMTRQFTAHEWSVIQSSGSEYQQLAAFYRHWALKESFIKAIGTGLNFDLQRVEFHLTSEPLTSGQVLHQTKMHLDDEEEDWIFEESLLDPDHHVAVALGPADKPGVTVLHRCIRRGVWRGVKGHFGPINCETFHPDSQRRSCEPLGSSKSYSTLCSSSFSLRRAPRTAMKAR